MNRDDVIRMAQESGVLAGYEGEPSYLERFAALVSAQEREACAELCERLTPTDVNGVCPVADAIRARSQQ